MKAYKKTKMVGIRKKEVVQTKITYEDNWNTKNRLKKKMHTKVFKLTIIINFHTMLKKKKKNASPYE